MVHSPSTLTPSPITTGKSVGESSAPTTPTLPQRFTPALRPSRPHSTSISSVHFADTLPAGRPGEDPQSPTRSVSHPILRPNGNNTTTTPPATPAPTPRQSMPATAEIKQGSSSRPLLHGKRASIVTGGYESSSAEDEPPHPNHHRHASYQIQSVTEGNSSSRPRARSLMFPISTPPISGSSSNESLHREKKPSRLSSSRHSSRDILRSSFRQPVLQNSHSPSRSPSGSTLNGSSVPGSSAPRSVMDSPSPAKRGMRKKDSSPSRLRQDAASPASNRSRKGKERAEPRRDILASSLGLGGSGGGIALTADQINDLLADSDVGAAIRSMGAPHTPSIPQPRSPATSCPTSPEVRQPYLASAPPPIMTSPTRRERTISISTTASSPRQPRRTSSIPNADVLARRRRASSRGTLHPEGDGGHVPFTHHVPPSAGMDTDEADDTEPSTISPTPNLPETQNGLKPESKGKRKRISNLFGLKHKRSDSSTQQAEALVDVPMDRDKERQKKETEAREKERQARDADMREKERQRRNDEIEEDRYFRALQQVSAHPHSADLADQAKIHLWTHYQNVFEGLEDPPRFNPVAILRWKHKVEEQESARKAWDQRNKHLGASVESLSSATSSAGSRRKNLPAGGALARWTYTIDDINRYKDTDGHVDYFIPPRQPPGESLPSVNELTALEHPDPQETGSTKGSITMQEDVQHHHQQQGRAVSNPSSTDLLRREDSRQSFEPLSRSPSNDRPRKISHRAHQSLGHIGPSAIGHALKAPFDKLGSIARRQLTLPPGDISDSTLDESPLRPLRNSTTPLDRLNPDPGVRNRTADRFFHRQKPDTAGTDDETKENRRRLFLKGDRTRVRRAETGGMVGDRQTELLALEAAIQREARWREQQDALGRRTKAEEEARIRLKEVEAAIYTERSRKLSEARGGVYRMDATLIIVEDNIKHYAAQMGQIRQSAMITAGLDLEMVPASSSTQNGISSTPPTSANPIHVENGTTNNPPRTPSRPNTPQDRSNRDRLFLAGSKLMQTQHALQGLEESRVETARQLGSMVDELRETLRRRDGVDEWSKRTMNEIDILRDRRNRLQSRFDDKLPWYRSRSLDPILNFVVRIIARPVTFLYTPVKQIVLFLTLPITLFSRGLVVLLLGGRVRVQHEDEWVRISWKRYLVERGLLLGAIFIGFVGWSVWAEQ